jgi:Protein of unknown function (DUF3732)
MYFQIRQLILWRRTAPGRRVVNFEPGMVNVISGASKTGKSAVIPIIDYCLASDRCAIPVGVIREACEWFGVVIDTAEGQKLLARREPGDQQQTSEMFVLEGEKVEVPEHVEARNSNTGLVKAMLDRLSGLSSLGFEPDSDSGFKNRPAFRDLMAFTFQPQNIIANPDVLFFKADTTEHREKLKTIFPYILNAVTAADLAIRWEVDRLQKLIRRKEIELNTALSSVNVWKMEAHAWIRQGIDLGLLASDTQIPGEWPDILDLLRSVAAKTSRHALPSVSTLDVPLARLAELRKLETEAAEYVSEQRQGLNQLRRLIQNSIDFGSAMRVQRDRLALSKWLRKQSEEVPDAIATLGAQGRQDLDLLVTALEGIEVQLSSHPTVSDRLDREQLRLRAATEDGLHRLAAVRQEIVILERDSEKARDAAYGFDQIERFLGRLQQALSLYDRADGNAELRNELAELTARITELRGKLSEYEINRRTANATKTIESAAASIIPELDAEWPDAALKLVIADLTVKVVRGNRDDYLWEIGSGANWLAYHLAITLSLQRFFLDLPHHPVPGLLVYDQPSQVYFPRRAAGNMFVETEWRDEDVVAVKKVFRTLASEVLRAKGRLQAIVLDHADEEVWGGIEGVKRTEEWRDGKQKLVPIEWLGQPIS